MRHSRTVSQGLNRNLLIHAMKGKWCVLSLNNGVIMSEFHAWEVWLQGNAILILTLIGIGLGALVKLSLMVWNQHQELEKSALARVIDKIDELVGQIQVLFIKHDTTGNELANLRHDVSTLEVAQGACNSRCRERGKVLDSLVERQEHYEDLLLASKLGYSTTDIRVLDEIDLEK